MQEIFNSVPKQLVDLIIIMSFSLLLGIEQRRHFSDNTETLFGTDRTFTFIGILGYLTFVSDIPNFFLGGLICLTALLSIYYFFKIKTNLGFGSTSVILALIIYIMPMIVIQKERWVTLLIYVILMILVELKDFFQNFSNKLAEDDFFTLGKFILMAGIILPALPKENISAFIPVSAYKIWLAIVVISGISYISYILKKYIFPNANLLLTAILGGLYSSTATTFIIARKGNKEDINPYESSSAIIAATAMMYLRIFVIIVIFNTDLALSIWYYFLALFMITSLTSWYLYKKIPAENVQNNNLNAIEDNNPLEFKIALVFAFLYIVFTLATHYTLLNFGSKGLNILSLVVGFTDIDPFLMNLFQGTHSISTSVIISATLQAIFSNNILKMVYSIILSNAQTKKVLIFGFSVVIVASFVAIIVSRFLK